MSVERMMKTPCTVIRRIPTGEKNRHGVELTEPDTEETRCALQQQRALEVDEGGETSDTRWLLILPHGTEVDTGDAVEVRGDRYEIEGDPWSAEEGSRSLWHVEVQVRRTSGARGVVGS